MRVHFSEYGPIASCFESQTGGVEFGACGASEAFRSFRIVRPLKVSNWLHIYDYPLHFRSASHVGRGRLFVACVAILFLRNSRLHAFLTFPLTYQIDLHKGRGVPSGNIRCVYDGTRSVNVCVVKVTRNGKVQVRLASLEEQLR